MRFYSILLILVFFISACKTEYKVVSGPKIEFISMDSSSQQDVDSSMLRFIQYYKNQLSLTMGKKVAFSPIAIERQQPNGALNNLTADIIFSFRNYKGIEADFCLLNYGGLRSNLPTGNISVADIYQLMPFDNKMVIVKIKPQIIDSIVQYIYSFDGQPISGIDIEFMKDGSRKVLIKNKAIDYSRDYYMITSDYLAQGGDKMSFLTQADSVFETNISIRDAFFLYFHELEVKNLEVKTDISERIKYEK